MSSVVVVLGVVVLVTQCVVLCVDVVCVESVDDLVVGVLCGLVGVVSVNIENTSIEIILIGCKSLFAIGTEEVRDHVTFNINGCNVFACVSVVYGSETLGGTDTIQSKTSNGFACLLHQNICSIISCMEKRQKSIAKLTFMFSTLFVANILPLKTLK